MDYVELKARLKGAVTTPITPFRADGEVDKEGVRKLTRFLIDSGIREGTGALIPTSTTAEFSAMSLEERKRVVELTLEEARGEVPVFAGCNHTNSREALELCRFAEEAGALGIMISPPYYFKPLEENIIEYYRMIASETRLAIIVYNNDFASQTDIPVEVMEELSRIESVIGMKETTRIFLKFDRMVRRVGGKIAVLNGYGELYEPYASLMGTPGFITVMANFAPGLSVELYRAAKEGDLERARELHLKLCPLLDFMFKLEGGQYVSVIKEAMNLMGLPAGPVRPPLLPLKGEARGELKQHLRALKLL